MTHDEKFAAYVEQAASLLQEKREALGLSRNAVAQKAGLALSAISMIEDGERRPSLETFAKISMAIDSQPSEILKEAEKRLKS